MQSISTSSASLGSHSSEAPVQLSQLKKTTLRQGANHPDVAELQQLLGLYVVPAVSSKTFDDLTDYVVRLFQYLSVPDVSYRRWDCGRSHLASTLYRRTCEYAHNPKDSGRRSCKTIAEYATHCWVSQSHLTPEAIS